MADNYESQQFEAIEKILGELKTQVDNHYHKVNARIDILESRIDSIELRINQRFNRIEPAMLGCMTVMFSILGAILAKI